MNTRLAIVGFEHVHAPHYLSCLQSMPDVSVVAISEADTRKVAEYAEQIGAIPCVTDYTELLQSNSVDGVILCSANSRHKQMVIDIARAGISILCEKPLATKTVDAREMLAIAEAHGTKLGICFPCRFSESLQQGKHLIESGGLGQIVAVKATNHGTMPGDWFADPTLSGGGAIMDHTVHVVDALRWMFEQEFVRVYAQAATRLHTLSVEDVAVLNLEMSNGLFVTLDCSWSRPSLSFPIWGDVRIAVVGTSGILNLDLFPWTLSHYSEQAAKHVVISHDGDLNPRMLQNFVHSIQNGQPISPNGLDGLRALEVVEAAYGSVATGNVVLL
jgi:predicted dehydrogenase